MSGVVQARRRASGGAPRGFTLIEILTVVAIVGLLAAVAYPSYVQHLVRGHLAAAASELDARRATMEQYFLSNHTYADGPCASGATVERFTLTCSSTASAYTVTATGSGIAEGFVYTIDQHGTQRTTGLPSRWGSVPDAGSYPCWINRTGQTC